MLDTVCATVAAGAFPLELGWLTHLKVLDLQGQSNMPLCAVSCLIFTPKNEVVILLKLQYVCVHALTLYLGVLALFEAHTMGRVCMWRERELSGL